MHLRAGLVLSVLWLALPAAGWAAEETADQPPQVYQIMGGPPNPKVPAHWNRYHDYRQATELLQQLSEAFPESARLSSLGTSHGGRQMWLLTISDFASGADTSKPAMWIDGGIHANEIQSTEVVLYTAWYLLEMQSRSASLARLLKERAFYLLPMLSPDSRDAHFYQPHSTHTPRSGQRPVDDDRDGLIDEDGPDDLDGDGHITQMRVQDPNGRWKPHPDFPELLVRCAAGEKGTYTLLGGEGIDNDGDGQVNEDGDGSYDPNRNWGWNWQPPHVQGGAHRYPFSIPENRYAADFIREHPNIAAAQSYHNTGGMILRGPGAKSDSFAAADVAVYDALGKRGEELLPGYQYKNVAQDLYEVWGGELDWLHQMRGVFALTNELFTSWNYFRGAAEPGFFGSPETQRRFDKYLLLEQGFTPWTPYEHPQYGQIEIGGARKNWGRQPPSFLLEEECHRNMAFSLYHAGEMPLVKIQSATARSLGGDLFEVTAVLENPRLIPTHSAADLKHKLTPPDLVSIAGAQRVILALRSDEPFFEQSVEQQREPERLQISNIPGQGVVYARWLVQGAGPYRLELTSIKGGRDALDVEIPAETAASPK